MAVAVRQTAYGGWSNCVHLTNGNVDVIVTADVGPRVIRYGFTGEINELCEIEETRGVSGGDDWRIYGGHRLWHSPESATRTYVPDNNPVRWEEIPGGIRTLQDVEGLTGIEKQMDITISVEGTGVSVHHRLINRGSWPVELSVWSITAMACSGREVVPQRSKDTGLLPNRLISLWPYSRLDDPRVIWGGRYIILTQDPLNKAAFKFGVPNASGWAAYFNHGNLFVKYFQYFENAQYPDFGVSYETYVNDRMLEMESLSPLALLSPEADVTHAEEWELFRGVPMPGDNENEIEAVLHGRVRKEKF